MFQIKHIWKCKGKSRAKTLEYSSTRTLSGVQTTYFKKWSRTPLVVGNGYARLRRPVICGYGCLILLKYPGSRPGIRKITFDSKIHMKFGNIQMVLNRSPCEFCVTILCIFKCFSSVAAYTFWLICFII